MAEIEKELRHYLEGGTEPQHMFGWARDTQAAMVDLKFCDLLGTWQHVALPSGAFDESAFEGPRLRRILDPRLAGHRGERHDPHAGRVERDPRSVH